MNEAKYLKIITECMRLIGYAIGMSSMPEHQDDLEGHMKDLNSSLNETSERIMKEIESA